MATLTKHNTDWRRSAGDFTCTICLKKRLPASSFSKTQSTLALKNYRTQGGSNPKAKCKECVQQAAQSSKQTTKSVDQDVNNPSLTETAISSLSQSIRSEQTGSDAMDPKIELRRSMPWPRAASYSTPSSPLHQQLCPHTSPC